MFFLKFLTEQIDEGDEVTRSFIEMMLPNLMEQYAVLSAKGGEHSRAEHLDEETRRKFEAKSDQNMVSHQLNGLFPTLRLLNILEAEGVGALPFTEIERRVYILAYLMHDVDKIVNQETGFSIKGIRTRDREAIEQAKEIIATQLRRCNVEAFLPAFATYLEDITYLVVNTQQMWGTNLHTYLWRLQLRERRVLLLRRLCTFSDHMAYLVSSPSAILLDSETKTLTTILSELSDDTLVFCYHQLRDVRGLFTNVINDGLVTLFTQGHDGRKEGAGIWPYLFFSNGVVYIQRKALAISISTEQVVETVRGQLREICADRIKTQAPGFKFSIQGIAKHPGYYFEFLTLEEYAELLALYTIRRTTNDITVVPLAKLRQMQANGELPASLAMDFSPDMRIGMVSRFLSVVFMTLLALLDKKQAAVRTRVEQEVVRHLGLDKYWAESLAIPNKGGVEYRWFWLGACYLRDHAGLDLYDGENSLLAVFRSTLDLVMRIAGDELRQQMPQRYLQHLPHYLASIVELPPTIRADGGVPDFQGELDRYAGAKAAKGRKLICTLCNSAYPTEEQSDNAVLFQPWVYKNKLSLYAGKNAGGVCAICALELMLRQILQKGLLRLTGSKFEALKTKYLTIYPNFFFTRETGALVQGVIGQLQDVNFFTVRRQLEGKDITLASLMQLDVFAPNEQAQPPQPVSLHNEDFGEEGDDADSEEGEAATTSTSVERSYIKFQATHYPGLCFFGMRAGKDDDDTSSWAMPAFLALALPLVTNTKVVLSEMPLPLFASGHDFHETVLLDAPHAYLSRLLKGNRLRVNQLLSKLALLSSVYRVNLDTYAKQGKPEWKHLGGITRDLTTDPLFLFSYLRKQQRDESQQRDALRADRVAQYLHIYKTVMEENLGKIEQCVDLYTVFYRGGYESHSILKPVDIVAKAIINSPLEIEDDDLLWQIRGEIKNWLDRVRNRQAKGYAVFWGKDIDLQEGPALQKFVEYFYYEVFKNYCQGERGTLRSRLNRFKDGCEAYYIDQRRKQRIEEQEAEPMVEAATV